MVAAASIGIGYMAYLKIKRLVMLLEPATGLSDSDAVMVRGVVEKVNKTNQIIPYYPEVQPLIKKVWGTTMKGMKRRGVEKRRYRRREEYISRILALSAACERSDEIEIPYLPQDDMKECLKGISAAISALGKLKKRIRGAIS